jgi:hypothetical protein
MILPLTGLFALIESLDDPIPRPGKRSELVVKGSKCLTTKQQKKAKASRWPIGTCAQPLLGSC